MIKQKQNSDTAIILGAGSSGLAAAYELKKRGLSVRIIEKAQRPGEAWHHRHPQLRLNTHRKLSKLPGRELPKSAGAFPSRDSIIQYIEDYAHQLNVPIDYGVNVNYIDKISKNWHLETDASTYISRNVIIATGYDRVPHTPEWSDLESFDKKIIHAANFGDVSQYRGKKILVVGAGNSGSDVLNHLSRIETGQIWVSVRHGPVIFPTYLYGIPVQLLSPVLSKLPTKMVDSLLTITEFLAFGNLKKFGLLKHAKGGATRLIETGTAPGIDNGFIAAMKAGRVKVIDEIKYFSRAGVHTIGGKIIEPDIVIAATGYRTGLESLLGHTGALDKLGVPIVHGAQQLEAYPGLYFTGMQPRLPGAFHAAGIVGKEIANAIEFKEVAQFKDRPGNTFNAVTNTRN